MRVSPFRFGSLFFSPDELQVKVLIEVLAKRSSKTILVSGNCSPEMRSLISRTIEAQPEGTKKFRVETWVDQQAILGHRVRQLVLAFQGIG